MVPLNKNNIRFSNNPSSKGNQLKFTDNHIWYKTDYTGYEGLSEYMVSELIAYSNLDTSEFVRYETELIIYDENTFLGCKSFDFLPDSSQLITLERLYKNETGKSLYQTIWQIPDKKDRAISLVNTIQDITGIKDFGIYLTKLLTIDAVFLNEDRHFHNLAVLMDSTGRFSLCPIFDNGASLFSDTKLDYPVGHDLTPYYKKAQAKTFSTDFDEQLDLLEELFGQPLHFHFTKENVKDLLSREPYYPTELKQRVSDIIFHQMNRYSYLME